MAEEPRTLPRNGGSSLRRWEPEGPDIQPASVTMVEIEDVEQKDESERRRERGSRGRGEPVCQNKAVHDRESDINKPKGVADNGKGALDVDAAK